MRGVSGLANSYPTGRVVGVGSSSLPNAATDGQGIKGVGRDLSIRDLIIESNLKIPSFKLKLLFPNVHCFNNTRFFFNNVMITKNIVIKSMF